MAIEKALDPRGAPHGASLGAAMDAALEVDLPPDDAFPSDGEFVVDTETGDLILEVEADVDVTVLPHDANLAEHIDETDLMALASDLVHAYEADDRSRAEWYQAYTRGLDLLGMKAEERSQPWQGASGVVHPMLTEAVVRFQAQAMGSLMPARGPARTKILGRMTPELMAQATRVENELNYLITEEMPDYRDETEQMLFKLPLAGSAFKKLWFDPLNGVPASVFVPAEDFVVAYGASSLRNCPRYTHVMRKTDGEVRKLQHTGFYRDIDLAAAMRETTSIREKEDSLTGVQDTAEDDPRRVILEMHVDLALPEPFDEGDGVELPYVVAIDRSTNKILSIRRNWEEGDRLRRKQLHFVHYMYLPGMGFYGTGLIHLIGGLTKSATSILRQLIDAGTLSNLPAGFKARGARIKGDSTPLRPGEWRDIDVPSGALKESMMPLPYKEPSTVLYQLLGNVVEEGRRIGSVADLQIGSMNAQMPVGTTLALLERSMKVMSGVQARLHAAMKQELRLLARIVRDYMPPEYSYDVGGQFDRVVDFGGPVDVIPVSDPNAATMAQKVVQYQAALELSKDAPQLYNRALLHRQMLEVLEIQDAGDIVKLPDEIKPKDPVAENMAILMQQPVKAFLYQDHEAHIATHMAALQDPKLAQIVGQSPFAGAIQAAMVSHITEHVAFQYRKEIEQHLGVPLPDEDTPLPEDVEVQLSRAVAAAAAKLLQKDVQEAQAQQAQQEMQNPLTRIQLEELELKKQELAHKMQLERAKLELDAEVRRGSLDVQRERTESEDRREGARIGMRIATQIDEGARKERMEGARLGIEAAKTMLEQARGVSPDIRRGGEEE